MVGIDLAPASAIVSSIIPQKRPTKEKFVRKLPELLTSLYDREHCLLSNDELKVACENVFKTLSISEEAATYLEESTHLQLKSTIWRQGRITASMFHAVSRTPLASPAASVVNRIVDKGSTKRSFAPPPLQWGIDHEDNARNVYVELVKDDHSEFACSPAGLFVNPDYPHLGASPDGVIECNCCGTGLSEVKCPFKYRDIL